MMKNAYDETLTKVSDALNEAEYIIVGGASGMSAASGPDWYNSDDPTYLEKFHDIEDKYHAGSLWNNYYLEQYTGQHWQSKGDYWGFKISLAHFVLNEPVYQPYKDLKYILKNKKFDIVTTNQDGQFLKAFPDKDIALIQGDWHYFQDVSGTHDRIYPSEELVEKLYPKVENGHLPEELIPYSSEFGEELHEWVRGYNFLEGTFYKEQYGKYQRFINSAAGKKVVYLELGVGMMTPMFIKEPFMNLTYNNPLATYITVNPNDAIVPKEIEKQGIPVKYDLGQVMADLKAYM